MVLEVLNDHGHGAVRVQGRGGEEVVAVRGAGDPFGPGVDEAGELAKT